MLDKISESRLELVYPGLAEKIRAMSDVLSFRVTQGLRTYAEQTLLYNQGRNGNAGKKVTDAKAGESWHNFGLAVDVVPMVPEPDWDFTHPVWGLLIETGQSLGLLSGSCFITIKDRPHFQLTGRFPESPTDEVRSIYAAGGLQAVWAEAFKTQPEMELV